MLQLYIFFFSVASILVPIAAGRAAEILQCKGWSGAVGRPRGRLARVGGTERWEGPKRTSGDQRWMLPSRWCRYLGKRSHRGSGATPPPPLWCLAAAGWVPDIGFVRILTILNCIFFFVNRVSCQIVCSLVHFSQIRRRLRFCKRDTNLEKRENHAICVSQVDKSGSRNHQILNKQTVHSACWQDPAGGETHLKRSTRLTLLHFVFLPFTFDLKRRQNQATGRTTAEWHCKPTAD